MDGVGLTSLWVAAMRAVETERDDALVRDRFARALAGDEGFEILARSRGTTPLDLPVIPIRTKWIDEIVAATKLDQLVILAAGMDARAWRMDLRGKAVFEVDRAPVLAHKLLRVGHEGPLCDGRFEIPIDLRDDWPSALSKAGFDATRPAMWLVEGLLVYLEEAHVRTLFARIDALSAKGSEVVFESNNRALLSSPIMAARVAFVRELGAPWIFGADEPTSLFPGGWSSTVEDLAAVGARYGRWPLPEVPKEMLSVVPRTFLVRGAKL